MYYYASHYANNNLNVGRNFENPLNLESLPFI